MSSQYYQVLLQQSQYRTYTSVVSTGSVVEVMVAVHMYMCCTNQLHSYIICTQQQLQQLLILILILVVLLQQLVVRSTYSYPHMYSYSVYGSIRTVRTYVVHMQLCMYTCMIRTTINSTCIANSYCLHSYIATVCVALTANDA